MRPPGETVPMRIGIAPYLLISLLVHAAALTLWNTPGPPALSAGLVYTIDLVTAARSNPASDAALQTRLPERLPARPGNMAADPRNVTADVPSAPRKRGQEQDSRRLAGKQPPIANQYAGAPTPSRIAEPETKAARPDDGTTTVVDDAATRPSSETAPNPALATATEDSGDVHAEGISPETEQRLHLHLRAALARHFHYPLLARRRGLEGEVKISLRIEPDGELSHIRLAQSSGHAVLDEAAIATLGKVGRLPQVVPWLKGAYFDMILPIRYRLTDS